LVNANADLNLRNKRRVNTFYHTFSKTSGKPREVKRGDVPQGILPLGLWVGLSESSSLSSRVPNL